MIVTVFFHFLVRDGKRADLDPLNGIIAPPTVEVPPVIATGRRNRDEVGHVTEIDHVTDEREIENVVDHETDTEEADQGIRDEEAGE